MVTQKDPRIRLAAKIWQRNELPTEFRWMERLSPLHYRLCIAELHAAMGQAHLSGDWDAVAKLIEDWEATAVLDANPEIARQVLSTDESQFEDLDPDEL